MICCDLLSKSSLTIFVTTKMARGFLRLRCDLLSKSSLTIFVTTKQMEFRITDLL